jgi:anti-sigma factor RsiW
MVESVHLLTGAYTADALDPVERTEFERHLADCPDCAEEVRGLRETAAWLGVAEAVVPPDSLREAVLSRLATTEQLPPEEPAAPPEVEPDVAPAPAPDVAAAAAGDRDRLRRRHAGAVRRGPSVATALLATAAVLLLVVAVGLGVLLAHARDDRARTSAQARTVASLLAAPDAVSTQAAVTGGGQAAVVVSPSQGAGAFLASGLETPPAGHVYELWYITPEGAATPAGTFVPDAQGDATTRLVGTPTGASVVGMTVEPAGGSPQPTTGVVVALDISSTSTSPSASGTPSATTS